MTEDRLRSYDTDNFSMWEDEPIRYENILSLPIGIIIIKTQIKGVKYSKETPKLEFMFYTNYDFCTFDTNELLSILYGELELGLYEEYNSKLKRYIKITYEK